MFGNSATSPDHRRRIVDAMNSGKPGSMAAIQLYASHAIKRLFLVVAKGPKVVLEKNLVARGTVVF